MGTRTKLVVGNWKMNLSLAAAAAVVESFVTHVSARSNVDVVVCPPFTTIPRVHELLRNTHIRVGAQDVFWIEQGAFTGRISAPMLYDLGVSHCIVGHSETRGRFGKLEVAESTLGFFSDTDHTVNLKIRALLYHSINPVLCVGETIQEREAGHTDDAIRRQLLGAFEGIESAELFFSSVAYEPVWAIGTGNTCDAAEANRVCGVVREVVKDMFGVELAGEIRVLYGGSVKSANSAELFSQSEIDGGLVGGASLDPNEFSRIVMSA
jgi:triosephosphate isomerase